MKALHKSWVTLLLCVGGAAVAQPETPKLTNVADVKALEVQVRDDLRHVMHLRERSRQEKDVIKLNCVNDKLVQIKALTKVFDNQRAAFESSLEDSKTTPAVETADSIRHLRGEADGCVGESEISKDSLNDFEGPTFPDDPTKGDPFEPGNGLEPPGYASPYS